MSENIKVGDKVRILPSYGDLGWSLFYGEIGKNTVGTEFVVTRIVHSEGVTRRDTFYVEGDPQGRGIWAKYVELVEPRERKAHTTTIVKARENWGEKNRIIKITSGSRAIGVTIADDPTPYPYEGDGRANLTPEQAEEIANDLLERVAEIRAGLAAEAGA